MEASFIFCLPPAEFGQQMHNLPVVFGELFPAPSLVLFLYFVRSELLCEPRFEECFARINQLQPNLRRSVARYGRRR